VKVNVVTNVLTDDDPAMMTSELANATVDNDPVKVDVEISKLTDNDPVHQTGKKKQFNVLDGKAIYQIPRSTSGEPSATLQRTYVSPSTVDLTDNDPLLIIDGYSNGTKRNSCFQEWGVVHLLLTSFQQSWVFLSSSDVPKVAIR
jgi:hypothetical protein